MEKDTKQKLKKVTIGILLVIFACLISFFIGGVMGFFQGYSYSMVRRPSTEGLYQVTVLRAIREGKIDGAINLLETALDRNITEQSVREGNCFPFDIYCITQYDMKFMSIIAKYRKEYPTRATNAEVRKRIEETLARYETSGDR